MNAIEVNKAGKPGRMKNSFLFLFIAMTLAGISGWTSSLSGQGIRWGNEKVFVHTNKPVYVAGEMLKYRVYTFDTESSQRWLKSKILYFVLTDYKGNPVLQWRIDLEKENIAGSYRLPADLHGGAYTLTAYTNRMRNDPGETLCNQNIIISSLSHDFPDTLFVPVIPSQKPFGRLFRETPNLILETGKEYPAGDTAEIYVSLGKEFAADTASVSLSVYLSVPLANTGINDSLLQNKAISKPYVSAATGIAYPPFPVEDKSYMLSGTVKNRISHEPVAGGKIILASADSLFPHILYSRTDSEGRFVFYPGRWFDNRELILQNAGSSLEGGIVWEIDSKLPVMSLPVISCIPDRNEINSLAALNESWLIEAIYDDPLNTEAGEVIPGGANYFGPPDVVVKPADFTDLVNLKEITENLFPGVRYAVKNNSYTFQIYNVKTGQWMKSDMILLNGVPFFDMNFISTLGTKDISRIEIISGNYILGDLTLEGLVSIYTNDHKVPAEYLKNRSFTIQNRVAATNKPSDKMLTRLAPQGTSHDPDFRMNLLWDPVRNIAGKQKLEIRFPVSLLTGTYDIVINGITRKGLLLSGKGSFEVK